jgi:hypothetical protein
LTFFEKKIDLPPTPPRTIVIAVTTRPMMVSLSFYHMSTQVPMRVKEALNLKRNW